MSAAKSKTVQKEYQLIIIWLPERFTYFSHIISFDIACKLSLVETICMECQSLFSEKNKNKYLKYFNMVSFIPFAKHYIKSYIMWAVLS